MINEAELKRRAAKAAEVMRRGGTILYPTDTIWGLGCDARNDAAVERLYDLKERPHAMSMLVIVECEERLQTLVGELSPAIREVLRQAIRPTTIIYPHVKGVAHNLCAADGSLGIRVVKHPLCEAMVKALDAPIVSTSANLSGQPTGRTLEEIDPRIRTSVDWVAPPLYDTTLASTTGSRILKFVNGDFEVIRE